MVGAFDRSHYEDVVVVRVRHLVARSTWSRRYATINRFEDKLVGSGTRVLKCFLHISKEEQKKRLLARLNDPTKYWKYNPGDVDERARWDDYQQAYAEALSTCNTESAPWYVVPSDHKWYRNWAITKMLIEQLDEMALSWPPPDGWDPETERLRVIAAP
jgi:polyphosphate kinase 2 (PPK2 family)